MDVDLSALPIFVETGERTVPIQIGTGVFLIIQSEPFLFTAAHITDGQKGRLLIPTAFGLQKIEGRLGYIPLLPGCCRNDDNIDIACFRLSADCARALSAFSPPLVNKAEIIQSLAETRVLAVVGYPSNRSKYNGKGFSSDWASYRGFAASEELYVKLKLHPEHNLIIQHDIKESLSPEFKKVDAIWPQGVSGGAIFAWPKGHETSQDWGLPTLVGIVHSYKKHEGVFVGTTLLPYLTAINFGRMQGYRSVS